MRAVAVGLVAVCGIGGCFFDSGGSSGDDPGDIDAGLDGDGAAGAPDASPDANTTPPAANCGGPGIYIDDFDDGLLAEFWNPALGFPIELGGRLQISVDPLVQPMHEVRTRRAVDITGGDAIIEIAQIWTTDTSVEAYFSLRHSRDGDYTILMADRQMIARVRVGDTVTESTPVPFVEADHKFWRFSERDGTLSFDVSADGSTFATIHSIPTPPEATAARLVLGAFAPVGDVDAPDQAVAFDNLNATVPPVPRCAASSLSDDFEDGIRGVQWAQRNVVLCTPAETGGQLVLDWGAGNFPAECRYNSRAGYALADSEITLAVDELVATDFDYHAVMVMRNYDLSAFVLLGFADGEWCARTRDAVGIVTSQVCATTPPAPPMSWRLREAAGTFFFEHSTDGVTFTEFHTGSTPFPVSDLSVGIGSGAGGNVNTASTFRVGALN